MGGKHIVTNKINSKSTAPISDWRKRCERSPQLFAPLAGTPIQQRKAERWEAGAIGRLTCDFETLAVRAAALRSIAELRECSVRQVAMYFEVEADIVVAALSLLESTPSVSLPEPAMPALTKAA